MIQFMLDILGQSIFVANAQGTTSIATSTVGNIVDGMLEGLVDLFTENIDTVLLFAVSFMVLSLLLAVGRRFFRI